MKRQMMLCRTVVVMLIGILMLIETPVCWGATVPVPTAEESEFVLITVGGGISCPPITTGTPPTENIMPFVGFLTNIIMGKCSANSTPAGSMEFVVRRGEAAVVGVHFWPAEGTWWVAPKGGGPAQTLSGYGLSYPAARAVVWAPGGFSGSGQGVVLPFTWGILEQRVGDEFDLIEEKPYLEDEGETTDIILWERKAEKTVQKDGLTWNAAPVNSYVTRLRPDTFAKDGIKNPPLGFQVEQATMWGDDKGAMQQPQSQAWPVFQELDGASVINPGNDRFLAELLLDDPHDQHRQRYELYGGGAGFPFVVGHLHTIAGDMCVLKGEVCRSQTPLEEGGIPVYLVAPSNTPLTLGVMYPEAYRNTNKPQGFWTSMQGEEYSQLVAKTEWKVKSLKTGTVTTLPKGDPDHTQATLDITQPGGYEVTVEIKNDQEELVVDKAQIIVIDLDIDSDNTDGLNPNWIRTPYEDQIEDIEGDSTKPGKFIAANMGDVDNDGVPNFADFEIAAQSGGESIRFTPLVLELPRPLDVNTVKVKFTYSVSDPAGVTGSGTVGDPYLPADGHLRIWKVDGSVTRNVTEVNSLGGHFVNSGSEYRASEFGSDRIIRLYVEGIAASAGLADQHIKVEIDPNGDEGEPEFIGEDAVRITVVKLDIVSPPDRSDHDVSEENYTTTPPIPFRARTLPTVLNWQGHINWTFDLEYDTTISRGPWRSHRVFQTENNAIHEERYSSEGGKLSITARVTNLAEIPDLSPETKIILMITGVPIPDAVITARLISLYNGATPNLLTGIAAVESGIDCYCQFFPITKYGVRDSWPRESYDGGSHIGLMQVPVTMEDAWNWLTNTQTAVTNHFNPALARSHRVVNDLVNRHPDLPELTGVQHENNALSMYRTGIRYPNCFYYVPNVNYTDWIVNPNNPVGVNYANNVRQNLR